MIATITSPDDRIVSELCVSENEYVRKGQIIARLNADSERLAKNGIQILFRILEAARQNIGNSSHAKIDEAFDLRRKANNSLMLFRKNMLKLKIQDSQVGAAGQDDINFAKLSIVSAEYEEMTLKLEETSYKSQISIVDSNLNDIERILIARDRILDSAISRCVIVATSGGYIKWMVFADGFISRGEPLACVSDEPW